MMVQMENDPKMANKPEQVREKIVMGKLNKFYAENLRVSLQVQNLFYWAANKRHLDPEVWSGRTLSPSRGYRIPPTWTLGLSLNF